MKPLSALVFVLSASLSVEAGLVGLRDAFFGTGPYSIAPLQRRAGGIENPQTCVGIQQASRFQPYQPNQCRILEMGAGTAMTHAAWNYCPASTNGNCQIPAACVDDDLCTGQLCGVFGDKQYTTITCSDSFHCGHTALIDASQRNLDATRWVCNKTPGFAMTISGKFAVNNNVRSFDGTGAAAVVATTFDPQKTSSSTSASSTGSSSTSTASSSDSSTITSAPTISSTSLSSPTSTPTSTPPKSNLAPIIGGTIGGLAALALLSLAIFLLYRRHKRNTHFATVLPSTGPSSTSSSEKSASGQATPHTGGTTAPSTWMPTPGSMQGAWTPGTAHVGGDGNNGGGAAAAAYSGAISEMPTPDMLGRDWNHNPTAIQTQNQEPVEMGTPTPVVEAWGGGLGQGQGHGLGMSGVAVAPGGLPVSLTPGRGEGYRAELA